MALLSVCLSVCLSLSTCSALLFGISCSDSPTFWLGPLINQLRERERKREPSTQVAKAFFSCLSLFPGFQGACALSLSLSLSLPLLRKPRKLTIYKQQAFKAVLLFDKSLYLSLPLPSPLPYPYPRFLGLCTRYYFYQSPGPSVLGPNLSFINHRSACA
jgi:hypothetical protein